MSNGSTKAAASPTSAQRSGENIRVDAVGEVLDTQEVLDFVAPRLDRGGQLGLVLAQPRRSRRSSSLISLEGVVARVGADPDEIGPEESGISQTQ